MVNDEILAKIMKVVEETNKKTIEEANNRQTQIIKQNIREEIIDLKNKFEEELNKKTIEFENKFKDLKLKYHKLEKELRKNNIIIFGLESPSENLVDFVIDILNQYLGLKLSIQDINNVYTIGKKTTGKPVIVKLTSYLKKQEVLKNCIKLKGTKISIAEELSLEERNEKKILVQHLKKARSKNLDAFIKNKKLVINDQVYTAQELADGEEDTDTEENIGKETIIEDAEEKNINNPGKSKICAPLIPTAIRQEEEDLKAKETVDAEKVDTRKKKSVQVNQPANRAGRSSRLNSNKD